MMSLSACQKGASSITCPVLVQYSRQYQQLAKREYDEIIKKHPKMAEMLTDYYALRQACRKIENKYY